MKVSYFREMGDHHLVITAGDSCLVEYQMKMIKQNQISGLICPAIRRIDNETEYDYLITGFQSLQTLVETGPISGYVLKVLVQGICALLMEMDRYMVDGEYLNLRPEYIYLERHSEKIIKVNCCIFLFRSTPLEEQIRELFKYIINEVDYQEKEAVALAYDLFQIVQERVDLRQMREMTSVENECEVQSGAEPETGKSLPVQCIVSVENTDVVIEKCSEKKGAFQGSEAKQSEEILWLEDRVSTHVRGRRPQERKSRVKDENTLPGTEKKSILKRIVRH